MNKMIWLTTLFVLFVVLVLPGIFASRLNLIPTADQPGYDSNRRLSIYGAREVSQKFISEDKNMAAIGTSVRNPNLQNKKDVTLNLYDENKNLIRTSTLNGQNIQDGDFIKFTFQPIVDSMGKTYSFTLSSPKANPEDTVEVFYFSTPTKDILQYTYDQQLHPGGIPIVTFSKPDSKLEVIKKVYADWLLRVI